MANFSRTYFRKDSIDARPLVFKTTHFKDKQVPYGRNHIKYVVALNDGVEAAQEAFDSWFRLYLQLCKERYENGMGLPWESNLK